jgi:hypothetical protein
MTTVTTKRLSWTMPTRSLRRRCRIQRRRKRRMSFCRIVRVTTRRKRLPRENRTGQEKIRHRKKIKVQEKSVLDDSSDEELDMLHPSRPRTQLRSQTPRKATISNQSLGITPRLTTRQTTKKNLALLHPTRLRTQLRSQAPRKAPKSNQSLRNKDESSDEELDCGGSAEKKSTKDPILSGSKEATTFTRKLDEGATAEKEALVLNENGA